MEISRLMTYSQIFGTFGSDYNMGWLVSEVCKVPLATRRDDLKTRKQKHDARVDLFCRGQSAISCDIITLATCSNLQHLSLFPIASSCVRAVD